ncbi:MAG TPA: penicillin-binding protein [Bryobacteraceae bacterium]|nr:penicillin-binding protein [Bryobacteraceae bacterium]
MRETQSTQRLKWLLWSMLLWVAAIFGRLVFLQVVRHDDLLKLAQSQQQKSVEIEAVRGTIFDRAGQPLAKTLPAESICVDPLKIPDASVAADILSRVLDVDRRDLFDRIQTAKRHKNGFLWVKRKVSADEATRVRSLKLDWVEFRGEMRRFYPHAQLAAHVLGSTGMVSQDDVTEHGNGGIELSFDDDLSGEPGIGRVYNDVRQNAYDMLVTRAPEPGANLTLTIDTNLQYDAEHALAAAVEKTHARTASLVALNPYTGEILAIANYPSYDPNYSLKPGEAAAARSNLAVSTPFEPGSVFKVITLSAALETTQLTPESIINCGNGSINLFGRVIHDHSRYAALSMADVLAKSSNIGAINVGLKVGEKNLYEYVRRFGFGSKSGIDLPGESAGMLRRLRNWEPSSIGSVAMGHEIGATSIQLALAGAVVANGGLMVKPRLVLVKQKPGAAPEPIPQEKPRRVIAPETAIKMRQMMEGVVLHGTGRAAILRGYTSGGKTGSAQIYDFKTRAYTHSYNASFLGFAPVGNPQIVIAVTLIGTTGGGAGFGGATAAPVFHDVATSALRMLDVPKDLPDTTMHAAAKSTEPGSVNDLAIAGLSAPPELIESRTTPSSIVRPETAGRALSPGNSQTASSFTESTHGQAAAQPVRPQSVSSVTPPPVQGGSPASANEPSLDRRPFFSTRGSRVPDFRGMTLRTVLEESAATGLPVEVRGDGLARDQDPPPGSVLSPGTRVRVQFAR